MGLDLWTNYTGRTTPPARHYLALDLPRREIRVVQQHRGSDANVGPSEWADRWEI